MNVYQRMNVMSNKLSARMDKLFNSLKLDSLDEELRFEREENLKLLAEVQTLIYITQKEVGISGERH
jgi:hypothetical protein